MHRLSLPPENTPGSHVCPGLSRTQGQSAAERIKSLNNTNDPIANRTRDLLVCRARRHRVLRKHCKDSVTNESVNWPMRKSSRNRNRRTEDY